MEDCFRFLINVDQCLNLPSFEMFFYQLESQRKFHCNQVQLFGDASLAHAFRDIRSFLNKYPYLVKDYQIIVAMRSQFRKPRCFADTMLYRLIRAYHELQKVHIYISSRERAEKALCLVMLYDADFSLDLPTQFDRYLYSTRLTQDCGLLLQEVGAPPGSSLSAQELEALLDSYQTKPGGDEALYQLMRGFQRELEQSEEYDAADVPFQEERLTEVNLYNFLGSYLRECLRGAEIFEGMIDQNNRRDSILALLRLVEYINLGVETAALPSIDGTVIPLVDRCRENWTKAWEDPNLEERYGKMLVRYQRTLRQAETELERPGVSYAVTGNLPQEQIPDDNEISPNTVNPLLDHSEQQEHDLRQVLHNYGKGKLSLRTAEEDWGDVYLQLKQKLNQMSYELQRYGEDLSRQYSEALDHRKKSTTSWRTGVYLSNSQTESEISRLEYQRELRLKELKSPQMNPSLTFQDQLNMENVLEQNNLNIQFYIHCLRAVNSGNLFALVGSLLFLTVGHYTFLQSYVFQEGLSLLAYLGYAFALALLLLCTWGIPRRYFKQRIRRCVQELEDYMDKYIQGYNDKAQNFKRYLNLLNQLDYLNRFLRLQRKADQVTHRLSKGYLWHKLQVKDHLNKLQFFQGLTEQSSQTLADDQKRPELPTVTGDHVGDVINSPLYWPQR